MEGHRDTQRRMTNPALNWLRDVAIAVTQAGQLDRQLRAHQLLDILVDVPDVEVPGLADEVDLSDDATRKKLFRVLGRRLDQCFRCDVVSIDAHQVERLTSIDAEGRNLREYRFSAITRHATLMSPQSKPPFPLFPASPRVGSELSESFSEQKYPQYRTNGGYCGKRVSHSGEASDYLV